MNPKATITLAMLWIGTVAVLAEATWVSNARDFIRGKVSGAGKSK